MVLFVLALDGRRSAKKLMGITVQGTQVVGLMKDHWDFQQRTSLVVTVCENELEKVVQHHTLSAAAGKPDSTTSDAPFSHACGCRQIL